MVTAVTGATGHVGNVLVRELVRRGDSVRAVVLPGEATAPIDGLAVELVPGDVRDRASLERAFRGAELVFHLAGIVTIRSGQARLLDEVNVRGTMNVVEACRLAGVRRLVYTSSVHALVEPPHGTPVRETEGFEPDRLLGDYARSKARASIEVLEGVRQGLDAVLVYPSGIIGPFDYRPSEMGQLVLDFTLRRLPAYIDGEYDFVDVRDVAQGLLAAAGQGRRGRGYLLSGHRISVAALLRMLHGLTSVRAPRFKLPRWLALAAAAFAPAYSRITRSRPLFTSYSIKVLGSNCLMCRDRAEQELGFRARPLLETMSQTVEWFRAVGRLPAACTVRGQ